MTNRPEGRHTMRTIRTALTTAAAVALLAGCGGEQMPPTGESPSDEAPAPLDAEVLRDTLGEEAGELCRFSELSGQPERIPDVQPITSLHIYEDWEGVYGQTYGGCNIITWDEDADPDFEPYIERTLETRVREQKIWALAAEDERWILTVDDAVSSDWDADAAAGERIAELLGRGEPVEPG